MRAIRAFWRSTFDIRPGERLRALFMALYLMLVMFAHYVLKPISRGMFLEKFDIDKLPYLYLLLAAVGGLLATLYTRAALRASLQAAVAWLTVISVLSFIGFWWAFGQQPQPKWLLYVFNLWANLYGVVVVAQCFLVNGNVFTSREAKRVYGFIGLGANAGALASSLFTSLLVKKVGERPLLLVCALLVMLAYVAFRLTLAQKGVSLKKARAAGEEQAQAHVRDMFAAIGRHRHLQVIIGIITLLFVVDVLVDYQYNDMADMYKSGQISVFLANVNLYSNLLAVALQLLVTAALVSRLGVGGTMQIMPATVAAASLPIVLAPGILSTVAARLAETASRYSFNRTGMELLYMPLPTELRNRTKAFVDIAMDRTGRGLAAILLIVLGWLGVKHPRQVALVVLGLAGVWVLISRRAQKEYILTVRNRLDARRLDLESVRVAVSDPATLALLEQAAAGPNPRQACYALSLLAEAPGYDPRPLLRRLAASPLAEVRGKVYELARSINFPELLETAQAEIPAAGPETEPAVRPAVGYLLSVSPNASGLARDFLDHPNTLVSESALEAIGSLGEAARELVTLEWITQNGESADPRRRRLAALAVGVHGDQGTEALHRLFGDQDPAVIAAACRAAGALGNRAYLHALVRLLDDARLRGDAVDALTAYGPRIAGTLGDLLEDDSLAVSIRGQIPRVLRRINDQRSVDVLLRSLGQPDLSLRLAVLRALNGLREAAPDLDYGETFVTRQILNEARHYFELNAALEPFRAGPRPRTAAALLARTLEVRLQDTVERLFRLLGLRYPPKEIYAAYLAVNRQRAEELSAALEFLDNVLDRELKRVLLPLLDAPAHLAEKGRELFGVEVPDAEAAVRELIRSGDPWLVACAAASAAELRLRNLAPDIARAAGQAGREVSEVARAAAAALA
jgi:AAA family ATP:ADP antiporter